MAVKAENLSFEKALERLEGIVDKLESGDVGLADAVKLFEEGIGLRKRCLILLKNAEKRISFLTDSTRDGVDLVEPPDDWDADDADS